MKWISNFSGGLCSFFSTMRAVEKHGAENVIPLFADTLIEDEDLHAFNAKAEEILGVKIVRVCHGMTPWQLFRSQGLIANNRFPICSVKLKREVLDAWMVANYEMDLGQGNAFKEHAALYVGFDWNEAHRLNDMREAHPRWNIDAPMQWEPIWDKCRMIEEAKRLGLPEQKLYRLGFPHNNCGGRCVRAGHSHWVHLLRTLPSRYAEWEKEEQDTIEDFKLRGVSSDSWTILKDRRGGQTNPLSLRELRLRVEAGEQFGNLDWGGCGCS